MRVFLPSSWLVMAPAVVLRGAALPPGLRLSSLARICAMPPPSAREAFLVEAEGLLALEGHHRKAGLLRVQRRGGRARARAGRAAVRVMTTPDLEMEDEAVARGQDLESRARAGTPLPGLPPAWHPPRRRCDRGHDERARGARHRLSAARAIASPAVEWPQPRRCGNLALQVHRVMDEGMGARQPGNERVAPGRGPVRDPGRVRCR